MSEPEIDFLKDEAPEPEVVEQVAETVETPAQPVIPEATTAPEPKEDRVPLAALMAERDKRQEEARQRQELEARLRQYEQQQTQPAFHEAPELYLENVLQQREVQMQQRMAMALEEQARTMYPDYDDMLQVVLDSAAENPFIVHQLKQAPNPAVAAYKLGKQLRELAAMKDPEAYRAQIEAEVRAKITAEAEAKEAARIKAAEAIPPDLSAVRASKGEEVLPDDSLESILQSRKRR